MKITRVEILESVQTSERTCRVCLRLHMGQDNSHDVDVTLETIQSEWTGADDYQVSISNA